MNRHEVAGRFEQLKGKIKQKWGDLTDDEIAMAEGRRDEFIGILKQKYGRTEDEVRRDLDELERDFKESRHN